MLVLRSSKAGNRKPKMCIRDRCYSFTVIARRQFWNLHKYYSRDSTISQVKPWEIHRPFYAVLRFIQDVYKRQIPDAAAVRRCRQGGSCGSSIRLSPVIGFWMFLQIVSTQFNLMYDRKEGFSWKNICWGSITAVPWQNARCLKMCIRDRVKGVRHNKPQDNFSCHRAYNKDHCAA